MCPHAARRPPACVTSSLRSPPSGHPARTGEDQPLVVTGDGNGDPLIFAGAWIDPLGGRLRTAVPVRDGAASRSSRTRRLVPPRCSARTRPWPPRPICPGPRRSRSIRASMRAMTACIPARGSQAPRTKTGGPSANPVNQDMPVRHSMVWAKPVRSRHGPSRPNAGIRTMTSWWFSSSTRMQVDPELLHHPWREIFHQDIGGLEEALEHLGPLWFSTDRTSRRVFPRWQHGKSGSIPTSGHASVAGYWRSACCPASSPIQP